MNFVINHYDTSPVSREHDGTTGDLVPGGLTIDVNTFAPDCYLAGTGVALAPDGQSLYSMVNLTTLIQTDLDGKLLMSAPLEQLKRYSGLEKLLPAAAFLPALIGDLNLGNTPSDLVKANRAIRGAGRRRLLTFSLIAFILQPLLTRVAAATVTNVAAGAYHSFFIKSDGSLWAMGWNAYGQLGDGTFSNANRPKKIVASNVVAVAGGYRHSLFIKSDRSLWAMGLNANGQLGDGTFNTMNRPKQIVSNEVVAVAAGHDHSLFLKSDGSLWAMGKNDVGQLGDGTSQYAVNRPQEVISNGVVAIGAGYGHSLFIKSDGSLWAMGLNNYGQLGDGTFSNTNRPEQIVPSGVVAVSGTGNSQANSRTLFVKSDGSLWGTGDNNWGQFGDGTFNSTNRPKEILPDNVACVAGGWGHTLFTKIDGSLWATGNNNFGQLGDGTLSRTNVSEQIVSNGIVAIAAGDGHSLFLRVDGSLWVMGHNNYGQLGDAFTNYDGSFAGPPPYDYSYTNTYCKSPEQVEPPQTPVLTGIRLSSDTNLTLVGTCMFGGTYYLFASSDITAPVSQWTPVWTNLVVFRDATNFSATLPNAVSPGIAHRFYILRSH